MKKNELREQVALAVRACQDKKASDLAILQLDPSSSSFTDYFIICTGANPRQMQAIADDIEEKLSTAGLHPAHTEGYKQAEWMLLDYVDFVVHIFSESARKFYDLERLWKNATHLEPADLEKPAARRGTKKAISSAARTARPKQAVKTGAKAASHKRLPAPRGRQKS